MSPKVNLAQESSQSKTKDVGFGRGRPLLKQLTHDATISDTLWSTTTFPGFSRVNLFPVWWYPILFFFYQQFLGKISKLVYYQVNKMHNSLHFSGLSARFGDQEHSANINFKNDRIVASRISTQNLLPFYYWWSKIAPHCVTIVLYYLALGLVQCRPIPNFLPEWLPCEMHLCWWSLLQTITLCCGRFHIDSPVF